MLSNHIQLDTTPETRFNDLIDLIEQGRIYSGHQKLAMHILKMVIFLFKGVEDAILIGYQRTLNHYYWTN